jgi:hypothetical protein
MNAVKTRQKMAKNRSLRGVNEDFEPFFNAVFTSAIIRAKVSNRINYRLIAYQHRGQHVTH